MGYKVILSSSLNIHNNSFISKSVTTCQDLHYQENIAIVLTKMPFYKMLNYYVSDKPNCGSFLVDESHGKALFEHGVIKPSLSHSKDKVGSEDEFAA